MIARKSQNTPKSDFRGPKIGIWAKSEILNCFLCSVHPSVRLQKKRAGDIGTFQDMTFSNKPTSIQPESFLPERFLKGEQGGFTKPAHFQVRSDNRETWYTRMSQTFYLMVLYILLPQCPCDEVFEQYRS